MHRSFLIFLFLSLSLFAKNPDEIKRALIESPDSTELYYRIAKYYLFNEPDSARKYIDAAIPVAKRNKDDKATTTIIKLLGIWHDIHGEADSAVYFFEKAGDLYLKIKEAEGYADICNNLGYSYSKRAKYKEAITLYHRAIDIYDSLGKTKKMGKTLGNVGMIFQATDDLNRALENYEKALEVLGHDTVNEYNIYAWTNIASTLVRKDQNDSAAVIYQNLIAYSKTQNNQVALAVMNGNLALAYFEMAQMQLAIQTMLVSIDLRKKLKDIEGLAIAHKNLSHFYMEEKNYQSAVSNFKKSLELSSINRAPREHLLLLKFGAELYEKTGNYKKSSHLFGQFLLLKDSLDTIQQRKEIEELQEQYEASQRKREITELQLQNRTVELASQQSRAQRNVLLLTSFLLVSVVVFIVYRTRERKKSYLLLEGKNEVISQALEEKELLLKEIHHRVKNNLQIISSLLNLQSESIREESAAEAIKEGQNRVKSMALVHQKLYTQENIVGVNLKDYMEALTQSILSSYSYIQQQVTLKNKVESLNLDIDTIIPLALVVNELITNSLKYAFPEDRKGEISVSLYKNEDKLILQVADDGVGTKVSEPPKGDSGTFGLKLVHSLARKLKAEINYDHSMGTMVELKINRFKLV